MMFTRQAIVAVAMLIASGASAQDRSGNKTSAAQRWSGCVEREVRLGSTSNSAAEDVVDGAFAKCSAEQADVVANAVDTAMLVPSQKMTKQELTELYLAKVNSLRANSRVSFIKSVKSERDERSLDSLMSDAQHDVANAQQEKIEIYKRSCLNRDDYLTLLANVRDRDRAILMETCRTAGRTPVRKSNR